MSRQSRSRLSRPVAPVLHMKGKCPTTHKLKFRTELDALLEHQRNPLRVRAYRCQFCEAFHVTSKPCRYCDDWHGESGCAPVGD